MGDGRFLKQDNGDYIHVSEGEYLFGKSVAAVIGAFVIWAISYWIGIDWWNFDDFGMIFATVGAGIFVLGMIGLIIAHATEGISWATTFGYIFGTLLALAFVIWLINRYANKEEEKKKDKQEQVEKKAASLSLQEKHSPVTEDVNEVARIGRLTYRIERQFG